MPSEWSTAFPEQLCYGHQSTDDGSIFLHSPLSLAEFLFPLPTELLIDTLSCRIRLQGGYRGNV